MAKTQVKFLSGYKENLPELIVNGQVYFVVSEDGTGKILFDRENQRYVMSETNNRGNVVLTKQYYQIGEEPIKKNELVGLDKNGLVVPAARAYFLVNSPLFISAIDCEARQIGNEASFYSQHNNILIKNNNEELNGIAYKPLLLKGKVFDGLFKPAVSEPFTYTLPKREDGYCYIYIGEINSYRSINNNNSYINFSTNHPIYHFVGDELKVYSSSVYAEVAERLAHSLTIGKYIFDGSEDVVVPTYGGELTI